MNTSVTGISPSNGVYPGLAKADKGPLESPVVRIVQETRNLGNGEFVAVKEVKPVVTAAEKRMFSQIKRVETRDSSSQVSSPDLSPEEVAPESSKRAESNKAGAGKVYKFKKAASPDKEPSPVSPSRSAFSPRRSSVSFRPDVEVEESFTTTPVTRQPSVFKPASGKKAEDDEKNDGVVVTFVERQADGSVKTSEFGESEASKILDSKTTENKTEIKADKSQPRSKIKFLGVISLIAGIALAAFGFYIANALAVICGLGMMGVGSISYLVGRRIETTQARNFIFS